MTVPKHLVSWQASVAMVRVRDACGRAFFVEPDDLIGRSRVGHIIEARNAACWVLRHMFGLSYPCLGKLMGHRDHSTVINACQNAEARRARDAVYRLRTDELLADVPVSDLTPLPPEIVAQFVEPEPEEKPVCRPNRTSRKGDEVPSENLPTQRVKPKNRIASNDFDGMARFHGTRALAAAIAASGGRFR